MEPATLKMNTAVDAGVVTTDEDLETLVNESRLQPHNAIPIPPALGKVYAERYKKAKAVYKRFHDDWKKVIEAFNFVGSISDYNSMGYARENFIRDNVRTMLEHTYMQNPTGEFTATSDEHKDFADALSHTVTTLVNKINGLGLNMRPHVLRAILFAHLTNYGWIKIQYTGERNSRQDAMKLYSKLQDAIHEGENLEPEQVENWLELMNRLYSEMQTREDFGIRLKVVNPLNIFVDPDGELDDLSTHNWLMELESIDEAHIKTEYLHHDAESNTWRYRYDPEVGYRPADTKTNDEYSIKQAIVEDIMPDDEATQEKVAGDKVPCIWVYDRTLRKYILYILGHWDTPLWVFEDELQLSRFFPYYLLAFGPAARGVLRFSDASFYLPFQDDVNEVNKIWAETKRTAASTYFYDKNKVDRQEVDKLMKAVRSKRNELTIIGMEMQSNEGDISKVLTPFVMPVAQLEAAVSDTRTREAIDRASRISVAMRGAQFNTNTNTAAVETYQNQKDSRISTFIDPIEEFSGQIMWSIAEIIVARLPKESLTTLVSAETAAKISTMSVSAFNQLFTFEIEAGSVEKPNSQNKKEEAVQIIQMLGQFGTAAPRTVLSIVSRMLRTVFSRHLVSDKDLQILEEEGAAAMQKGVSTTGSNPQQQGPQQ